MLYEVEKNSDLFTLNKHDVSLSVYEYAWCYFTQRPANYPNFKPEMFSVCCRSVVGTQLQTKDVNASIAEPCSTPHIEGQSIKVL